MPLPGTPTSLAYILPPINSPTRVLPHPWPPTSSCNPPEYTLHFLGTPNSVASYILPRIHCPPGLSNLTASYILQLLYQLYTADPALSKFPGFLHPPAILLATHSPSTALQPPCPPIAYVDPPRYTHLSRAYTTPWPLISSGNPPGYT